MVVFSGEVGAANLCNLTGISRKWCIRHLRGSRRNRRRVILELEAAVSKLSASNSRAQFARRSPALAAVRLEGSP